jgi:VanZ family protein
LQKYKIIHNILSLLQNILYFCRQTLQIMNAIGSFVRRYPLSLVCIALIWVLSLTPFFPETPFDDVQFIDKWTHLVMYGGTTAVVWWEYLRSHRRADFRRLLLWGGMAMVALGGLMELLQAYCTTTRSGEWLDFWADSAGVLIGILIGMLMWLDFRSRR